MFTVRHLLLIALFYNNSLFIHAQTGKELITGLQSINQNVTCKPCGTDSAAAISHRAMNIFLADKTGYLSGSRELSFYTNYATFNIAEGKITINHNFQKSKGIDEPVKKLFSIGLDMTIGGSYGKSFLDKRFENELGFTVNHKWLGKVKTRFAGCIPSQNKSSQKQAMDAYRAVLVKELEAEIINKEAGFELALHAADSAGEMAKSVVRKNFYEDLQSAYEEKFATSQAAFLTKTNNFKLVSTSWTGITAYIPLSWPRYTISPSLVAPFTDKHPYPFNVILDHTRFWESAKAGRIFLTLECGLLFNNSKLSYGLSKLNFSEYKSLGGTGIQQTADPGNNKLYVGAYTSFVTPSLSARLVYFPPGSHVGISFLAEKDFNDYHPFNCKLGIPIVLINSKRTPAMNVECYILFLDTANQAANTDKTSIGLSIGLPFSRMMY